ncbi:MAG TPA: iron uptake transporter deferrochelatase/peroxidase subunit [Acidimicrobiia bacterium]|nr:iron uptake transporter deferrochelatase/peroxidase subunit [Acidimicrobiia bacterium]
MARASQRFDPSRRRFLTGAASASALAIGAPVLLNACGSDDDDTAARNSAFPGGERVPFHGVHQSGVLQAAPAAGIVVALDSQAKDRAELDEAFRALSDETRRVMDGTAPEERDPSFPPSDSGVLGDVSHPAALSVIVGVGASLFDERYGLASRKPRELEKMPFVANDRLDPARSHGDISLTVSASSADVAMYALRQLLRKTRGAFTLRWMQEGFNTVQDQPGPGKAAVRNLLGFKDGSNNLDPASATTMDKLVWVDASRGEPAWAVNGSYQAIRIIRMFVEFWDRTRLSEQEALIGRHKASGAPLGGDKEDEPFDFADDPHGDRIPLDAHIRLANPRTPETEKNRILRRGFSYSRGFDGAGHLDQGLLFSSFQASLTDGFLAVQRRLAGEPLEEYILPEGGGFFYVLPGAKDDRSYLGQSLLAP